MNQQIYSVSDWWNCVIYQYYILTVIQNFTRLRFWTLLKIPWHLILPPSPTMYEFLFMRFHNIWIHSLLWYSQKILHYHFTFNGFFGQIGAEKIIEIQQRIKIPCRGSVEVKQSAAALQSCLHWQSRDALLREELHSNVSAFTGAWPWFLETSGRGCRWK